ncbi:hypothetical protein ABZ559_06385 [Streptococcus sp. ZY19097]|uniref:hypothetical protein n=1 Tax=Streptococcus sp. ZY19097 TaxID=3231906 RepID=UPI003458DC5A
MNSKDAISLLNADISNLDKIKNYVNSYDKQLLTAERFVFLVKLLFKEEDNVQNT